MAQNKTNILSQGRLALRYFSVQYKQPPHTVCRLLVSSSSNGSHALGKKLKSTIPYVTG